MTLLINVYVDTFNRIKRKAENKVELYIYMYINHWQEITRYWFKEVQQKFVDSTQNSFQKSGFWNIKGE